MSDNPVSSGKGRAGRLLFGFPLWLVLGLGLVLGLAVLVMAVRNVARGHEHVTRNFLDRADALIWALEAGTRTWLGFQSERALLQPLIEETAGQPGIIYLAVVDRDGLILAHSDPARVGNRLPPGLLPPGQPPETAQWRILENVSAADGQRLAVCEVYREFAPVRDNRRGGSRRHRLEMMMYGGHGPAHGAEGGAARHAAAPGMSGPAETGAPAGPNRRAASAAPDWTAGTAASTFALVGFDHQPYLDALADDRANSAFTASLVGALALGGILSLFRADSHRRSRRLFKNTQALAAEVMTGMPLGLLTSDPRGNVGLVNPAALEMLGRRADDLTGVPLHSLPGLDWKSVAEELKRKRRLPEQETILHGPAGPRPVSLGASQIRGENGEFLGCVVLLRDIAEMKRLQEELRRSERLSVLGSLAAGVAHEIRNPLSSIKGLATYLARKVPAGGAEEEAARTMIAEVGRLNRVVTELLEFSRPAAVNVAETDVNSVIERALRLAGADLRGKRIRVDFQPEPDFPKARLDGERLAQALLNLFLNAAQAMDEEGRLQISLEEKPDGFFSLSVRDSGPGIPPEAMPSIFTPYFTTKASGTGLGLAIVQQIAEGHGGRVLADSRPGEGSAFTLLLPLNRACTMSEPRLNRAKIGPAGDFTGDCHV